jgi:UrcA family protein
MQRSIRKISSVFGAAVLALGFSGFSLATNDADLDASPRVISYSDLDLNRMADATQLYSRIERMARDVCHSTGVISAQAHQQERACKAKAVDEAVQSVNHTNLTAVYQSRVGKRSMVASSR